MKLHYDQASDSLYIELSEKPGVDSDEVQEGVVLDYDENRRLVGIDIQHASRTVDLSRLEAGSMPLSTSK